MKKMLYFTNQNELDILFQNICTVLAEKKND